MDTIIISAFLSLLEQASGQAARPAPQSGMFVSLSLIFGLLVIFYILIILPQRKKQKKQMEMAEKLNEIIDPSSIKRINCGQICPKCPKDRIGRWVYAIRGPEGKVVQYHNWCGYYEIREFLEWDSLVKQCIRAGAIRWPDKDQLILPSDLPPNALKEIYKKRTRVNFKTQIILYAIFLFFIVVLFIPKSTKENIGENINVKINTSHAPQKPVPIKRTPEYILLKGRWCSTGEKKEVDPQIETNLGKWINEKFGLKMRWVSFREWEGVLSEGYLDVDDYAVNGENLWAVGNGLMGVGYIFHSSDSGKSWELQWKESDRLYGSGTFPFVVFFLSETEGWVGSKDGLFYTRDGGKNWEFNNQPRPNEDSVFGGYKCEYSFYSKQRIVVRLAYDKTYESLDGGKSWRVFKVNQ